MATTVESRLRAPQDTLRGYVILLFSTLVLSTTGVLIKFLLNNFRLEPLALAFWRVLIVAVVLGLAFILFQRSLFSVKWRHVPMLALFGLVGVGLHQLVWITSLQTNGVAVATVLVYIQPAIVALVSFRFLGESLDRTKIIALILTLTGMVLVSRAYEVASSNLNWLGLLTGLGTGFTWASYALIGRYITRYYSAWTCLFYAFLSAALFLIPMQLFVSDLFSLGGSAPGWGLMLLLALGPTLGGLALYTIGLSHLPASVATIIGTLDPVIGVVLAYIVFGEVLSAPQILGAGLILWSVVILRPK